MKTLEAVYKEAGDMASLFAVPAGKSIKSIKTVVCLISDEESLKNAQQLDDFLLKIKRSLPVVATPKESEAILSDFSKISKILSVLNKFFEAIQNIFDGADEATIDDDTTMRVMGTMQQAQKNAVIISDYYSLLIQVQKAHADIAKGDAPLYSYEDLLVALNAA